MSEIAFVVPGRLDQLTGGYIYDRRIVEGLRARGRAVRVIELPSTNFGPKFPLADGTVTVIDGLAVPKLAEAIAAERHRLPLVGLIHHPLADETGLSRAAAERTARLEATLLSQLRGIICPSHKTAAAVEHYGVSPGRIAVVPPGTARPATPPARRRGRARALLCVASLVPRKGHRILIQALARIRELDWTLCCIGSLERDPPTVRQVLRMARAAGLERRISLVGEQASPVVARAYRAADIFVLPSFAEGYGMAYAEAMVYGLPIIGTTAGAIPETVPPEAGWLVPPGDPAALARALRRVVVDPAVTARLAAGSRAVGARLADWPQSVQQWENALDRLAAFGQPA